MSSDGLSSERRDDSLTTNSAAEPQNVVIPLDGSQRAARAILPAQRLAVALGLPAGVITVSGDRPAIRGDELAAIQSENRLQWSEVVSSTSPADGIAECAAQRDAIVVMATGSRGRSVAIIGSTAASVVGGAIRPVMLVGPETDVFEQRPIKELVVAVSGTESGESICRPALDLAQANGFDVHFVTVVQPTPEPANPQTAARRRFGPDGNGDAYMNDLVVRFETPGVNVGGTVLHDPLSPASAIAHLLGRRIRPDSAGRTVDPPPSVLVLGTKSRTATVCVTGASRAASSAKHRSRRS